MMHTAIIDSEHCIGCHRCVAACPVDAIVGTKQHMHTILTNRCIGCQLCLPPCPVDCIDLKTLSVTPLEKSARAKKSKEHYQMRQARLQQHAPKALPLYASEAEKKHHIRAYLDHTFNQSDHQDAS
jgi:Na+-translocating ferredoxin:NAD+ oxidoreductase subunit B